MRDIHRQILQAQDEGRPLVVVTVVACQGHGPSQVATKMLVDATGRVAGTVGGGSLEFMATEDAMAVLLSAEPVLKEYVLDQHDVGQAQATGMVCGGRVSLFFEPLGQADRVYLLGAGHVNRALHTYLAPLGFDVVFVDSRDNMLTDLPARHLQAGADYTEIPPFQGSPGPL